MEKEWVIATMDGCLMVASGFASFEDANAALNLLTKPEEYVAIRRTTWRAAHPFNYIITV